MSKLPHGTSWVWDVKLDGYRAIAVKSGTGIILFSRRRKSLNRQFPYIVDALASLTEGTVVDGELVAVDDKGRPDFNLLQNFRAEASRIHYYIFDLLCWNGRDLTRLPLIGRRALLKSLVRSASKGLKGSSGSKKTAITNRENEAAPGLSIAVNRGQDSSSGLFSGPTRL